MRRTHDQSPPVDVSELATPSLGQLQQEDTANVAVPVRPDGPVETHELPSRQAPAFPQTLDGTLRSVLSPDLKRKVAILCADGEWLYASSASSRGVRWPADVPLVVTHADAVYASEAPGATPPVTLSVIVEVWAD